MMRFVVLVTIILLLVYLPVLPGSKAEGYETYDGLDLALAILADPSTLINSSYKDTDQSGQFRQKIVLNSLGVLQPTDGDSFVLLSTGIAGSVPVTTDGLDPGSERGTWFGEKYPGPGDLYDRAVLKLTLRVPPGMHYISYDLQFFSMEYPDYVGTIYNDKVIVTVDSPSKGVTTYNFSVNSGDFVFESPDIPGTGFDLYSIDRYTGQPVDPSGVSWVTRTPHERKYSDAGASALITRSHPVSPNENITITFDISDEGDNQFDSAIFIDNVRFTGFALPSIKALKTWQDANGSRSLLHPGDKIHYVITISNSGNMDQGDNPGDEFVDPLPNNVTFIPGSIFASSGKAEYSNGKIIWNGEIPAKSSVLISYDVQVDPSIKETTIISNQGEVHWDSDGDNKNDAIELTDDPYTDDGLDKDGDNCTDDDDPTIAVVLGNFSELVEDFSDDVPGEGAEQTFQGLKWFSTSKSSSKSIFHVAGAYHYETPNSFKVQLRSSDSPQYWNYYLGWIWSQLPIKEWRAKFACGNNSEPYELIMSLRNHTGAEIARLKFEYVPTGREKPDNYAPILYYLSPSKGWVQLSSDYQGGYLFNGWYEIIIRQNASNTIDYILWRKGIGVTDRKSDFNLGANLFRLSQVVWNSTRNPAVAPMFFWDEHSIGFD